MFNQLFDEKEFNREFGEVAAKIAAAQKEAEDRKALFDREFDEAEKRINARIEEQRKMRAESERDSLHAQTHHRSGSCYNNAHRAHQQFVDEMHRQQFADFVNSVNMNMF